MAQDLADTVAIVTGSGAGIGRAIAIEFAAHGAEVVIATRSAENGRATEAAIRQAGGRASFHQIDVGDRDAIKQMVAETGRRCGRIDIVLHNAAVFPMAPLEDLEPAVLDETLTVNLKAAFWLTQEATPFLRRSAQGRVLVTSSVTGPRVAIKGLTHYAASKAGLNGFIRSAALELAEYGITVNGVEPGLIETGATGNLGDAAKVARMIGYIPLKRLGRPEEIAHAMRFLASPGAAFITGQTIVVDGGALLPESFATME
jgi:3-oxoacyl-[acyl-carrier protein] reductase